MKNLKKLQLLSVNEEGTIYLSSFAWVYQSAEGGKTWQRLFKIPDDSIVMMMINVGITSMGNNLFWAANIEPQTDPRVDNHSVDYPSRACDWTS